MEHHSSGISSYIKDIVYGANDGIITTFAVVTGAVGAGLGIKVVIILGIANLFADGFSMGASNFLGERSENSLYKEEEKREWREVKDLPHRERQEVIDVFLKHKFSPEQAKIMTDIIENNHEFWVDFMMKYELEMNAPTHGNEWRGSLATFVAFVIAGTLPLLSFLFADPANMFRYSIVATAVALFVVGSLRTLITRRNWLISGLEMLSVGGIAAAVSYGVGYYVSLIAENF